MFGIPFSKIRIADKGLVMIAVTIRHLDPARLLLWLRPADPGFGDVSDREG
jgi:hypothetical protein